MTIPSPTSAVQLPWMTAGIAVSRTSGLQRVWTGANASSRSRQRSHDHRARGSVWPLRAAADLAGPVTGDRLSCAVTVQSPGLRP